MEEINVKELLIENFKDDPIYKLCQISKLDDYLFDENILALHPATTYSTVETGKILGKNDSTIRNHFRSDLIEYIEPEKAGKYFRLNYKSIFRLHMIFLLMNKVGKTSVDILVEAGIHASQMYGGSGTGKTNNKEEDSLRVISNEAPDELFEKMDLIEKHLATQSIQMAMLAYEKKITDCDFDILQNQHAIELIKQEEYQRYLEEKQTRLLASALKKTYKKSMFGFVKRDENANIESISKEIEVALQEKEQVIKEKVKSHEDRIAELKDEKLKLQNSLEDERKKLSFQYQDKLETSN